MDLLVKEHATISPPVPMTAVFQLPADTLCEKIHKTVYHITQCVVNRQIAELNTGGKVLSLAPAQAERSNLTERISP
jgi:hypothetical protein